MSYVSHVMLDLETMSSEPDAAIIAIGAVQFSLREEFVIPEISSGLAFYRTVSLSSSMSLGGKCSGSTILWWMQQDDAARRAVCNPAAIHLSVALSSLNQWMPADARVWGDGASFDNVILRYAYKCAEMAPPWRWSHDRCYRTMKNLHKHILPIEPQIKHHAYYDAAVQAEHLTRIYKHIEDFDE